MNILVDTLSMSFKSDRYFELADQLGLTEFTPAPARRRFYQFGDYYDGVVIAYNTDEYNAITDTFLDISGKGCRFIETVNPGFDWFGFLHSYDAEIRSGCCHISRLDVALDIDDGSVTFNTVYRYTRPDLYVCRSKLKPKVVTMREECIYFGSKNSDRLLRIYNKALEQCLPDTDWLRFEFQMRNDNAISFYLNWCKHPDQLGTLFAGVLLDFLRFVMVPKGTKMPEIRANRHQGRLPTADWYAALIGEVQRIPQLYLPGEEYTLARMEEVLIKQSASRIKAMMIAHEGDLTELLNAVKHCKLNNKQRMLLSTLPNLTELDLEDY